jgi:hypothetical protein
MISFSVNMVTAEEKGKVKVLTSARARQDGAVDPERQVTLEQVHGEAPRVLKSHVEIGESSRAKPRVTTRILLNKWQRQLEKERYQKRKHEEERRKAEKRAGEIWSSTCASRSARIGGAPSSGTAGTKV